MPTKKEKPVPEFNEVGDELNFQTAFIQASAALDVAGYHAAQKQDSEALTTVAALYMKLGEILMQPVHGMFDDEDEDEDDDNKQPLGFAPRIVEAIIPETEGEVNE